MDEFKLDPIDRRKTESVFEKYRVYIFMIAIVAGALWYFNQNDALKTEVLKSISDHNEKIAEQRTEPTQRKASNPSQDYSQLYEIYGIPAISIKAFSLGDVRDQFDKLKTDKCDRKALYKISHAFAENSLKREAISLIQGFASKCPNSAGDLIYAGNLTYELGEYQDALKIADNVIHDMPSATLAVFLRGRALLKLDRPVDALDAYVDFTKSVANQATLTSDVFTDMALAYAAIGKYCEAASSVQTYIAYDYDKRMNNTFQNLINDYEKQGSCGSGYASGDQIELEIINGSILTTARINGIIGKFVVDTGASFVSITPELSAKAHLTNINGQMVKAQTANGETQARLITVDNITVGNLSAGKVPALIMNKSLQKGVDGLLGLSFLSRFNISTSGNKMIIRNSERTFSE